MKTIISISIILLFLIGMKVNAQSVQCKGVTKSGHQCKRTTTNANGYCYQHQEQVKPDAAANQSDKVATNQNKTPDTVAGVKNNTNIKATGETYNGHKVQTGPKGGKYYINKNGNKTYLKRK